MKKNGKAYRIKRGGLVCTDKHLTVQSHKNECDINRVMHRAAHGASLSHLLNHGGTYGDFSDMTGDTYEQMQNTLAEARSIFYDLPAELRGEFNNNPGRFFEFVNDPENNDRLEEIFPDLSEPGRQLLNPVGPSAVTDPDPAPKPTPDPAPEE